MTMKLDTQVIIWTSGVLGITAGYLTLITRPQLRELTQISDRLQSAPHPDQTLQNQISKIAALEHELAQLTAEADDFATRVPLDKELGGFLEDLSRCIHNRHLNPHDITPGTAIPCGRFMAQPVTFRVRGAFTDVHALLRDMDEMPRLTRIDLFDAEAEDDGIGDVLAEIQLTIFYQDLAERPIPG